MTTKKYIVVIQSGWVFVGDLFVADQTQPGITVLKNASCVRHWGTTAGLGEIALAGPTASTILDSCGILEFPTHAELFRIPCNAARWKK